MNLPFSLNDILERVIPGSFLLAGGMLFAPAKFSNTIIPVYDIASNGFLSAAIFIALSYAIGVLCNIIAEFFPFLDNRAEALDEDKYKDIDKFEKIKVAFSDVFDVEWSEHAWRLCYGITHHTDYSSNIELFAKLNNFCRSTLVSWLGVFVFVFINAMLEGNWSVKVWYLVLLAVGIFLFGKGARQFSGSFSSAIYESFYTWYIHKKIGK